MKIVTSVLLASAACVLAAPALARDSLGMYAGWGAFRDSASCYAVAMPEGARAANADYQPYATISHWPRRALRNQVHFRLSRKLAPGAAIRLRVGGQSFALAAGGGDAWAADRRMDAAIVAAIRSAETMRVSGRALDGRVFSDSYALAGAASAIDAAAIGCARGRAR